jgi:serine/threonine-protein kinase RsbW
MSESLSAASVGVQAVHLTFPAKAEYVVLGRLALSGITRMRALGDELINDLKLAVTEACTNSVRHAYGDDQGSVDIVYELHDDRLVVEVSDDGPGFDLRSRVEADELSEGGLGIAIIQALADEFEVGTRGDGAPGSRLRFVKFLSV